jgi:hypothetical protein
MIIAPYLRCPLWRVARKEEGQTQGASYYIHPYSHSTDDCWAHDPPTEEQLPRIAYAALALVEESACGT